MIEDVEHAIDAEHRQRDVGGRDRREALSGARVAQALYDPENKKIKA